MIKVYASDIRAINSADKYERLYSLMPEERRRKCDRIRNYQDKVRCLAAFELLRRGLGLESIELDYTKQGKPYLKDVPELHFNLSHSGDRVMCVIASDRVGCDVEKKSDRGLNIAKRFFHEREYEYLYALSEKKADEFTRIWTLKESVLKCSGDGIAYPMNDFTVVYGQELADYVELSDSEDKFYIKSFDSSDEYEYGLCFVEPIGDIEIKWVDVTT